MKPDFDLSSYLVTDHDLMGTTTLEQAVEQVIKRGIMLVQLREKDASLLDFYRAAFGVKRITGVKGIPLIISDKVDIVLAVDAAGVHVGQEDLPAKTIRTILEEDKLLGVSVSTVEEALQAERDGADYLGVSATFTTGTKTDAQLVSTEELRKTRSTVSIPTVVIGGINARTIPLFRGNGVDGIAVVSAIAAAQDIATATRSLKDLLGQQKPACREQIYLERSTADPSAKKLRAGLLMDDLQGKIRSYRDADFTQVLLQHYRHVSPQSRPGGV